MNTALFLIRPQGGSIEVGAHDRAPPGGSLPHRKESDSNV